MHNRKPDPVSYVRSVIKFLIFTIIVTIIFYFIPDDALARAGGGGGGKGGGILYITLLPFLIIYSFILSRYIARKHRQSKKLLRRLSVQDDRWVVEKINDRIELIYHKVQEAWRERDQSIARDFMSSRLFEKHKLQTDQMIRQGRRNMLERVSLKKVTIVEAADYLDDSRDRIWAVINGSMVDYIIDDKTNQIISGDSDKGNCLGSGL